MLAHLNIIQRMWGLHLVGPLREISAEHRVRPVQAKIQSQVVMCLICFADSHELRGKKRPS
jgi:hypothetical protein